MAKPIEVPNSASELPLAVIKQMITLSTAGFGLVAALAWNELVKQIVESYIKPYLPAGSATLSLFLYAAIVTTLAVLVTLQLTQIQRKLEQQKAVEEQAPQAQKTKAKSKSKSFQRLKQQP